MMRLKYLIYLILTVFLFIPANQLLAINSGIVAPSTEKTTIENKKDKRDQIRALKKQKKADRFIKKLNKKSNNSGVGLGLTIILVGAVVFFLGVFGVGALLLALGLVILALGLAFWVLGLIF